MQAGRVAYNEGKRKLAHDHWREAALVDPYEEKIWQALYRVVDSEEDRIVCLENIIAINPMNVQARRRLHAYQHPEAAPASAEPAAQPERKPAVTKAPPKPAAKPKRKPARAKRRPATAIYTRPRRQIRDFVGIVVLAVMVGLVAALAAIVLLSLASREVGF